FQPALNPDPESSPAPDDRLILLAHSYRDLDPDASLPAPDPAPRSTTPALPHRSGPHRVLVLGWSHKLPALIRELNQYDEQFEMDVISSSAVAQRDSILERYDAPGGRTRARQLQGDITAPSMLRE